MTHRELMRHPDYWAFLNALADHQEAYKTRYGVNVFNQHPHELGPQEDTWAPGYTHETSITGPFADWLEEHESPHLSLILRNASTEPVGGDRGEFKYNGVRPERLLDTFSSPILTGVVRRTHHAAPLDDQGNIRDGIRLLFTRESGNAPVLQWHAHIPKKLSTTKRKRNVYVTSGVSHAELKDFLRGVPQSPERSRMLANAQRYGLLGSGPARLARAKRPSLQEQWYPGWVQPLDETRRGKSAKQYHADSTHDIFADYLDDQSDHRRRFAQIVRGRMPASKADSAAHEMVKHISVGRGAAVKHKLPDGTTLSVIPHHSIAARLNIDGPENATGLHVGWDGPAKRWYNTAMTREEFSRWIDQFPEAEANKLRMTYGNVPNMYQYDEPKRLARTQGHSLTEALVRAVLERKGDDLPVGALADHLAEDLSHPIGDHLHRWFHGDRVKIRRLSGQSASIENPDGSRILHREGFDSFGHPVHWISVMGPGYDKAMMKYPHVAHFITSDPESWVQEDTNPNRLARIPARNQDIGAAGREQGSVNHEKKREIALKILQEAGLTPAAVRSVLAHEQGKGTKASVIQAITKQISPELAGYVASWWGLLSQEKAVTVFHPGAGEDKLHILTSALPTDELAGLLSRSRIPSFSIEKHPQGSRAFIYNPQGTLTRPITHAAGAINARHSTLNGSGFRLGSSTGSTADARAKYRDTISAFETRAGTETSQ